MSIRPLLLGAGRLALGQQVMFFITFASNPFPSLSSQQVIQSLGLRKKL